MSEELIGAVRIVNDFAAANGWRRQAASPLFKSAEIFLSQKDLWRRVLEINKLPPDTKIPLAGAVATVEGDILLAVTPEEYKRISPSQAKAKDAWRRLLAHELAHRLHVAVLNGDESAMGPVWFYEGFAVVASGQDFGFTYNYKSTREALENVSNDRAKGSYARYAAAVRFFATKTSFTELIAHASRNDFESWLRTL